MSVIKIIINQSNPSIEELKAIHDIVGGSVGELKRKIEHLEPVFDEELFTNEFEEKKHLLHSLINTLKEQDAQMVVCEDNAEINTEILKNILSLSDDIAKDIENQDDIRNKE